MSFSKINKKLILPAIGGFAMNIYILYIIHGEFNKNALISLLVVALIISGIVLYVMRIKS